jgi:DNA topoisomerase VI subunit B
MRGMADDEQQIRDDFRDAVNMTASELRKWLDTDESKAVGQKRGGASESVGHRSGRHIVRILEKRQADFTDDDYAHMQKVVGYVARHAEQRPKGDVSDSDWRYSLMNWGNDPEKH